MPAVLCPPTAFALYPTRFEPCTQLWDTTAKQWSELNATDMPIHRYRQSMVVHRSEGAVYLFGGESYKPYMYHNAVNRLMLPADVQREMMAESPKGRRAN